MENTIAAGEGAVVKRTPSWMAEQKRLERLNQLDTAYGYLGEIEDLLARRYVCLSLKEFRPLKVWIKKTKAELAKIKAEDEAYVKSVEKKF